MSIVLLAACAGEVAWPRTAGDTTCQEWTASMRPAQRSAMGSAILLTLRANDGVGRAPEDGLIAAFVGALGDVCKTTPDEKVSSVAATLYVLSDDLKR
ncbi:MAG TPA: hypothetical protein VM451_00630 [Candidatus Limnocylindria bacterium]|nr:hypothetical protein [Candidatus Limnocylindria bacterium]